MICLVANCMELAGSPLLAVTPHLSAHLLTALRQCPPPETLVQVVIYK